MSVADITFGPEDVARPEDDSQLVMVWRRFKRHKLAVVGLAIAFSLFLISFVGPFLSPYAATYIDSANYGEMTDLGPFSTSPQGLHLLGTDSNGRDYMTRLMQGGRVSLALAAVVTILTTSLGAMVGGISGYYGGAIDSIIMRAVDLLLTLPALPIFLVLYQVFPPSRVPGGSILLLAVLLIILGWTGSARLVRGMALSLKNQEFTEAARAVGASDMRIIGRHMLPNSLAPVLVSATLAVGGYIVVESSLSWLGFGVQPPAPSWGNMLRDVQGQMFTQPAQVFYPGMAIFLTSLSFNFIGDALRDALDPRLKM